jgi:hypothetical protein
MIRPQASSLKPQVPSLKLRAQLQTRAPTFPVLRDLRTTYKPMIELEVSDILHVLTCSGCVMAGLPVAPSIAAHVRALTCSIPSAAADASYGMVHLRSRRRAQRVLETLSGVHAHRRESPRLRLRPRLDNEAGGQHAQRHTASRMRPPRPSPRARLPRPRTSPRRGARCVAA